MALQFIGGDEVDYRQAYIRALRGGGEFPDEEYWKTLGLMVGTTADSVSGQFGKERAEVLRDIAAWASVEASADTSAGALAC